MIVLPETDAAVQRIGHSKTPEKQLINELEHLNKLVNEMTEQREVDQKELTKALYELDGTKKREAKSILEVKRLKQEIKEKGHTETDALAAMSSARTETRKWHDGNQWVMKTTSEEVTKLREKAAKDLKRYKNGLRIIRDGDVQNPLGVEAFASDLLGGLEL